MNIFIQAVGFAGMAVNAAIYQQKTRTQVLAFKLTSDLIWLLHYLLLGAYSGAAIALIGCVREAVFMTRWGMARKRPLAAVFIAISLCAAGMTWQGALSLLPAAAAVLSVISFAGAIPRLTRLFSLPIAGCMLTYDLLCGSVAGVVSEIFTLLSTVVGILRHDLSRRTSEPKP